MNKEQFELAYRRYMEDGGHSYDPWDIATEWDRYSRGRSWCNEFFNTTEGAKYVASDS